MLPQNWSVTWGVDFWAGVGVFLRFEKILAILATLSQTLGTCTSRAEGIPASDFGKLARSGCLMSWEPVATKLQTPLPLMKVLHLYLW